MIRELVSGLDFGRTKVKCYSCNNYFMYSALYDDVIDDSEMSERAVG